MHLVFHAVGSAVMLWVDGHYVGYAQDSMTAAEFDITDALQERGPGAASEALLAASQSDHAARSYDPLGPFDFNSEPRHTYFLLSATKQSP